MGASSGIFKAPEVAVMVAVVLFTTLLTPLTLRAAFQIPCPEDERLAEFASTATVAEGES
jgi:hypothetical protein